MRIIIMNRDVEGGNSSCILQFNCRMLCFPRSHFGELCIRKCLFFTAFHSIECNYVPHPSLFSVRYFLLSLFRCGVLNVFSPARINRKGNQVNHMYREWETRQFKSWRTRIEQLREDQYSEGREERQASNLESLLHWSGCCFSVVFCSVLFVHDILSYNTRPPLSHRQTTNTHEPWKYLSFCSLRDTFLLPSSSIWTRIVIVISLFSPFGVECLSLWCSVMFLSIIREQRKVSGWEKQYRDCRCPGFYAGNYSLPNDRSIFLIAFNFWSMDELNDYVCN